MHRLWAKIDKREPDECWPWTASTNRGYGQISVGTGAAKRPVLAHRLVYELTVGPIPEGMHVLHSCDNPLCCNPAHLRIGTDQDNRQDAVDRGRHARGLMLPQTKLTENDVREIRRRVREGERHRALAVEFGVTHNAIYKIVHGKTWKHVI